MPAISVIMPAYNAMAFLDEAVASIRAQSHRDFELVVVDDGSTDGTAARLDALAREDARLRVLHHAHGGVVAALNAAVHAANGRLLMRMDADDVALPERMAMQAAFLDAHPEVAAVGGAIMLIDAAGRDIRRVDYPCDAVAVATALPQRCPLAHPAVMMRRDAVMAVGGYRPLLEYAEDYDLWLRVAEHHALANLPDVVLRYRHHVHKVSVAKAVQQATATVAARAAAELRRADRADPTAGATALDDALLDRLGVDRGSLAAAQVDLLLAATISAINDGKIRLAAETLRVMAAYDDAHGRRARVHALRDMAAHHRRAGNWLGYMVCRVRAKALKLRAHD